jgi:hypothetical protein
LEIWSGADSTGALLATYNSSNPAPLDKNLVFGSKIYVKFSATDRAVHFMANWVCAKGKSSSIQSIKKLAYKLNTKRVCNSKEYCIKLMYS